MMTKCITLLLALGFMTTYHAHATPVAEVLKTKKVCEGPDGFIKATPGNETEMAGYVSATNTARKVSYSKIAKKSGVTSSDVGQEYAAQQQLQNLCK